MSEAMKAARKAAKRSLESFDEAQAGIERLRAERDAARCEADMHACQIGDLTAECDALAVQIERLRGLLMDMPWHVVEAAEVDDSIAEWFRRRDDLLFGGAAKDKP